MATFDLYGSLDLGINWPNSRIPETRNAIVDYSDQDQIGVSVEIYVGYWASGYVTYYGNFFTRADGSIGGTLTGMDIGLDNDAFDLSVEGISKSVESILAASSSEEAARDWEASLLTGNDRLDGSIDGGSVKARLMDGNDTAIISGGLFNDVNGNRGEDEFFLEGGGGMIRGGKDNDWIQVTGGQWDHVNGNNGEDFIINYSKFAGNIYGGKDNDTLVNAGGGGYFYGNKGADTFKPYAYGGVMNVMDFEVGTDFLDLSALGSYNTVYNDGDTLIGSVVTGELALVIEGVIL